MIILIHYVYFKQCASLFINNTSQFVCAKFLFILKKNYRIFTSAQYFS